MFDFSSIQKIYLPETILNFLQTSYTFNGTFIDFWLIPHFASGLILGYLTSAIKILKNWIFILSLFIAFELFENLILYKQGLTEYEPVSNAVFDIVIGLFGWYMIKK